MLAIEGETIRGAHQSAENRRWLRLDSRGELHFFAIVYYIVCACPSSLLIGRNQLRTKRNYDAYIYISIRVKLMNNTPLSFRFIRVLLF